MRTRTPLRPLAALALVMVMACDRPSPPSWPLDETGAVSVGSPASSLSLATDLSSLGEGVGRLSSPDGETALLFAFDGSRLVVELRSAVEPAKTCPAVIYLSAGAGAQRLEYRFSGESKPYHALDGKEFEGHAPRGRAAPGWMRVVLPTLGGDYAVHVEGDLSPPGSGCQLAPLLPTSVVQLEKGGGLSYAAAVAATPMVVAVRGTDLPTGPGSDAKRFEPETPVLLLGHALDRVRTVRFGDDTYVDPSASSAHRLLIQTPAGGDTDTIRVGYLDSAGAEAWSGPTMLPVTGTVHQIGDAMGALVENVWSTWLVILLVAAGIIFTVMNGFPQIRGFVHALRVVRGDYDNPEEKGEISHLQALSAALSATIGLGNIAGVAVAVTNGGPGAIFWMWVCGFLGMATKFSECTLSTATRDVRPDGTVAGGPMYYMKKELPRILRPMAVVFAVLITFGSFGGGNMFQSNQAAALWEANFGVPPWLTGLILVALVGMVIIGGIKRIGRVADKLVPSMCIIYVVGALVVIFAHIEQVPAVFGSIFTEAFSVSAAVGGTLGVVVKDVILQGFRRAAFSNEAGLGSAAIAHAAVKTDEPVREGIVASLGPFIDTLVVCTMTGLVILFSGMWTQQGLEGAPLTAAAFDSAIEGFGSIIVPIAVFLFATSTMISWSYYGEKGVEFMFGRRAVLPYRLLFVTLIFIGAVWKLGPVLDFSDATIGLMAVPNLLAVLLLSKKLRGLSKDYFTRLKSGQMTSFRKKKAGSGG